MTLGETERRNLIDRYLAAWHRVDRGAGSAADEQALVELAQRYADEMPRLPLSRCPLTGAVQDHSFDPWGLDGLWWNYENPVRPMMERIPSCIGVTGAVALRTPVEDVPWLCRPGPGAPYVLPRLLDIDGVHAVIREVPVGRHAGYAICYFAAALPAGVPLPNAWGTGGGWDDSEGVPAWYSTYEDADAREFSLSPWIARGKLFWIAPGDDTLTLLAEVAGCPFVGLPGERGEQRVAYGQVTRTDTPTPAPQLAGEPIDGFELFELEEGLREELGLPPLPLPVRQVRHDAVFPPHGPVDLAALLAEIEAFITSHPGAARSYVPVQAALGLTAGLAAAEHGDHAQALACYESALRLVPESVSLRSHRALSLHALGRLGESREALEGVVGSLPRGQVMPLVWMLLARRYVEDGDGDKARPLLDELARTGSGDPAIARFCAVLSSQTPDAESPPPEPVPPRPDTQEPSPAPAKSGSGGKLVLLALAVAAVGLGIIAASLVFLPGGQTSPASSVGAPSEAAPIVTATPSPTIGVDTADADESLAMTRALPGIWAPEESGCASGFGLAFTDAGRYAEGDEYAGEEGNWEIAEGRLIETITLAYQAEDEVSAPRITRTSKRYEYRIKDFTGLRMVLANGEAEMAFTRCPDGRRMFSDGESYP